MEIGIVAGPWGMSFEEVLDAYRQAEQLGFPVFYLGDHFEVGAARDSIDPYILLTLIARALFDYPVRSACHAADVPAAVERRAARGSRPSWTSSAASGSSLAWAAPGTKLRTRSSVRPSRP